MHDCKVASGFNLLKYFKMSTVLLTAIILAVCDARTSVFDIETEINNSYVLDVSCIKKQPIEDVELGYNATQIQEDVEPMDNEVIIACSLSLIKHLLL